MPRSFALLPNIRTSECQEGGYFKALLPSQDMRIGDVVLPRISFATLLGVNHLGSTREVDGLLPTGLFGSVYIGYADRFVVLAPW